MSLRKEHVAAFKSGMVESYFYKFIRHVFYLLRAEQLIVKLNEDNVGSADDDECWEERTSLAIRVFYSALPNQLKKTFLPLEYVSSDSLVLLVLVVVLVLAVPVLPVLIHHV